MSNKKRKIPFVHMAWRNARRNTRRTLLTVTAIMVAVAALIFMESYIAGALDNMLNTYARVESGHVRIRKEGYSARERFLPIHENIPDLSNLIQVIRTREYVAEALPRIRSTVLVDGAESNRPGLLIGIDLAHEEGYFNPTEITTEGRIPIPGNAEVLIGQDFAEKLNVGVGDEVTLLGQTAYRSLGGIRLTITGLVSTGMAYLDKMLLLASIDQVQMMTYLDDATTEILVFAHDHEMADSVATMLTSELAPISASTLEIKSWRQFSDIVRLMETMEPFFGVAVFILLLMAGLIIVNTMLMTVLERTNEFGMLSALGMRKSDVILLIVIEGLVIGLIGAVVGGALGTGLAVWIEQTGIDITAAAKGIDLPFQGILYTDWNLGQTLTNAIMGILTAGLAALYPAWRVIRKTPAEALRA